MRGCLFNMNIMGRRIIYIFVLMLTMGVGVETVQASTRAERKLVSKGNKLYTDRKYIEAASVYEEALKENPQSTSARYNLGLSQLRQVKNPKDTTPANVQMLDKARKNLSDVASRSKDKPGIAAKANYNLGNLEFNAEQYEKAIQYYKQSLRIDPNDENARKNLRIAQKKLQQQNQDKNQQNQQNQDKKQDQKDNKDQQDNKQNRNQEDQRKNQQSPQDQKLNEQTAERILQAMDNKENQTRARVNKANKGDKSVGSGRSTKRW